MGPHPPPPHTHTYTHPSSPPAKKWKVIIENLTWGLSLELFPPPPHQQKKRLMKDFGLNPNSSYLCWECGDLFWIFFWTNHCHKLGPVYPYNFEYTWTFLPRVNCRYCYQFNRVSRLNDLLSGDQMHL